MAHCREGRDELRTALLICGATGPQHQLDVVAGRELGAEAALRVRADVDLHGLRRAGEGCRSEQGSARGVSDDGSDAGHFVFLAGSADASCEVRSLMARLSRALRERARPFAESH